MSAVPGKTALLVRAAGVTCAFALAQVAETMRPLPIKALANLPDYIRGVALVRGVPAPVIDLSAFLEGESTGTPPHAQNQRVPGTPVGRFVSLRIAGRTVAVLVDSVLGIGELNDVADLPPLLCRVRPESIEAIGSLDAELAVVLKTARLVPESVWQVVARPEVAL